MIHHCWASGNGAYRFDLKQFYGGDISGEDSVHDLIVIGGTIGIYYENAKLAKGIDLTVYCCSTVGLYLCYSEDSLIFKNLHLDRHTNHGIQLVACSHVLIKNASIYNSGKICYINNAKHLSFIDLDTDKTTYNGIMDVSAFFGGNHLVTSINETQNGGTPYTRTYCGYGYIEKNTSQARSGSCLNFVPKDATYYIWQDFYVPVQLGNSITVGLYMKDDVSFNGDVQFELYFLGKLIQGPIEKTMTTSYAQYSITHDGSDINEDGIVTLRVKVRGSSGNVYADNLEII